MAVADLQAPSADEPDASPRPTSDRAAHLPYFAALDGVRGIAVAAVLLFHAGFSWMRGGYLGVSTFFTLSGFLITSLLLAERATHGGIELKAFWVRRFRRLLPAALACLVLVLLFGVFVADTVQREQLAGDVVAALAYVANWRFILADQSYADLFAAGESPVLHFWSLAIEEQFYLLYPLLIAGIVGLGGWASRASSDRSKYWFREAGRRYRPLVGGALVALILGSLALTLFGGLDDDHIYLNTFTRASELLVGGVLAVVLFDARVTTRLARRGPVQRSVSALGVAALLGSVALWITTAQTESWLYHGGLTLYAAISATLITAAILPVGPVAALLALRPLRHLGRISYGVYLYHWPVFLALRQEADLDQWSLLLVGGAITIALAELSYHLLEMPVRRGQALAHLRPIRLAPFAAVGIGVAAVVITATTPPSGLDFDGTQDRLTALAAEAEALPTTTVDPAAMVPPAQPLLAAFGDSTALQTSWGMANYLRSTGQGVYVNGFTGLGCSVIRTEQRRTPGATEVETSDETCNDWERVWKERIDQANPNIALVQVGPWEVVDRKLPGDDQWRGPGDPMFDDYLLSEMTRAVDVLSSNGGIVVWLTAAEPGRSGEAGYDQRPRIARYNELVRRLPELRPGKVTVVDLAGWIDALPDDEDARIRPDGVHFSTPEKGTDTSTEVAERFLGAAVLEAWRTQWTDNRDEELAAAPPMPLLVLGDATASRIGEALASWSGRGRRLAVNNSALPDCGIGRGGTRLDRTESERIPSECADPEQRYLAALFNSSADTVVLHTSVWDVTDRQLEGDPTWRAPGDPVYDAYLRDEIAYVTDFLNQSGVEHVIWLLSPHIEVGRAPGQPAQPFKANEPTRIDRLNDLIREVAGPRPFVSVLDYGELARSWPAGEYDADLRPDGVVPSEKGARAVAEWLGPQILRIGTGSAPPADADSAPPDAN